MRGVSRLLAGARCSTSEPVVEVRAKRATRPVGLALLLALTGCSAGGPDTEVEVLAEPGQVGLAPVSLGELPALDDPALDASVSRPRRDPVYPGVGHPVLDALHYDLDLAWDPDERLLTAEQTLLLRAARDSDRLVLDLSPALEVGTVRLDGEEVPFDRRGQDLRLEAAVAKDDRHVLQISYSGSPEPVAAPTTRGDFSTNGWTVTEDGDTWTMQEPTGAYSWYAVDDQPSDKATYDITVSVPSPRVGVANGQLLSRTESDGVTTTRWSMAQPAASYLVTVATGEYDVSEAVSSSGVPLSYWVPVGDEDRVDADAGLAEADRGLAWLEEKLGPYPFDALGFLFVDSESGMETQTMITLGMTEYTTSTPVLVHEMAHHWWGDLIGPTTWRDLWMNEGMAMYLQGAWMASEEPYTLPQLMDYWAQDEPQMRADAGPAADYDPATFGEGNAYYSGALMWHEIRGLLGDELFWRLVREWPRSLPYGTSDYDGIVGWWSREAGRDLAPVFDAWLRGEVSPPR